MCLRRWLANTKERKKCEKLAKDSRSGVLDLFIFMDLQRVPGPSKTLMYVQRTKMRLIVYLILTYYIDKLCMFVYDPLVRKLCFRY